MFFLRAHHSPSSDGDDFLFSWSSDNATFSDLLTVTKTADDGGYQIVSLPPWAGGTLWIRAVDTDRSLGNGAQDTLSVDHMFLRASSAPQPPPAPTGLTATAVSSDRIDLTWNDNAANEDGYEVERSTDGTVFALVASLGQDAQGYSDTGLAPVTEYSYRVHAVNAVGPSGDSNAASATTLAIGTSDALASAESTPTGSIALGSFVDTHAADGSVEELREERTPGPPSSRVSSLEHVWTFDVAPGSSIELYALAHHTPNAEGDDFVLAWSTDGVVYTDALTVTKLADDGVYQMASLPASVSGTVTIRARDTDRTPGNGSTDSLFVDHLFIRSQ